MEIKKGQIKYIHVLKSEARISDEDYRTLLKSKFNKKSCTGLTEAQASVLIRILKGFTTKDRATAKQIAKFNILFENTYGNTKDKKEFIREQTGYNIGLYNLTGRECSKLIVALEKIKRWKDEKN